MLIYILTAVMVIALCFGITGLFLADYQLRFGEKLHNSNYMIIGIPLFCGAFSLLFKYYGYAPEKLVEMVCLMAGLMVIARVDREKMIIPNEYLLFLTLLWVVLTVEAGLWYGSGFLGELVQAVFGLLLGVSVFVIARIISPGAIGMGDIKLFAVLGIYFGVDNILMVMLASLVAAAVVGVVKVLGKKLAMKEALCMGPYIAFGTLIVMVLGV